MAKPSYKIPTALDKSALDVEVTLQNNEGVGLKPLSLRSICFFLASFFILYYVLANSFMKDASFLMKFLFFVLWIGLTFMLGRYTGTKELAIVRAWAFLNYLPKNARKVMTRKNNNAFEFYHLLGIHNIHESGLIEYVDGTKGYMYRVVGSASALLFDTDRNHILDRVDSFYMRLGTDVELTWITTKEAQKVYQQVANLKRRYDALVYRDPELLNLMEEQFEILTKHVGKQYRSIHQYLTLRADNDEALRVGVNGLLNEIETSNEMIKQCTLLLGVDVEEVLKGIYQVERG